MDVFLGSALVGFSLIIASYLLDLHSVEIDGREVGYFAAINWSVNYAIFFPFMLYFMMKSLHSVETILAALSEKRMLWKKDYQAVEPGVLQELWWERVRHVVRRYLPIAIIFAGFVSYEEWFRTNFSPLILYGAEYIEGAKDWGVAALFTGDQGTWSLALNAAFDFVCFSVQAALIFCLAGYFLLMVEFARLVSSDSKHFKRSGIFLIPDVKSDDKRRGFEEFEPLLTELLFASLFAYILAYLSRLQYAYLSCLSESSLWGFIKNDILTGMNLKGDGQLFNLQTACESAFPMQLAGVLMLSLTLLVLLVLIFIVFHTIRETAKRARRVLQNHAAAGVDTDTAIGVPAKQVLERLGEMQIWPMDYPRFNMLLILSIFGITALFAYRIGLIVLGVVLATVIVKLVSQVRKSGE